MDPAYGAIAGRIGGFLLFSPAYTLKDLLDVVGGQHFCITRLYDQWMAFSARALGLRFGCPVIVIQGADDVLTPTALVAAWVEEIEAPRKAMIAIPGGGHLAFATAADVYLEHLLTAVRPLARERIA